jgi:7,8-dihydropterin-6-yl-methyl-4-(beta-D-ribofuranosyl)aminobenzene 5'-phosphate synthase
MHPTRISQYVIRQLGSFAHSVRAGDAGRQSLRGKHGEPPNKGRMMKRLVSILALTAAIVSQTLASHAATQTKPASLGVVLTNAYDAFGFKKNGLKHHFGFSTVVEYKGKTILFDAGTDARIFEGNLKSLKIDLRKVDVAVVSHGHYDHIGGFDYLLAVNPKVKIYLPNDFLSLGAPTRFPFRETEPDVAKTLPKEMQYFGGERGVEGMVTVPTGRFWRYNAEYLTEPKEVLPGVTVIPTTSKLMGTFIKYPPFENNPQFVGMPELSVSFATESGEVILSGCSHSTIETIVQETQKVRKGKIHLVVGGFHLIPYGRDYIEGLAKRMKEEYEVESVAPAHCSGHLGFSIFQKVFGAKYRFFGLGERIHL